MYNVLVGILSNGGSEPGYGDRKCKILPAVLMRMSVSQEVASVRWFTTASVGFPASPALFIAYPFDRNYASSTVNT